MNWLLFLTFIAGTACGAFVVCCLSLHLVRKARREAEQETERALMQSYRDRRRK